jgi:hypothetical protein
MFNFEYNMIRKNRMIQIWHIFYDTLSNNPCDSRYLAYTLSTQCIFSFKYIFGALFVPFECVFTFSLCFIHALIWVQFALNVFSWFIHFNLSWNWLNKLSIISSQNSLFYFFVRIKKCALNFHYVTKSNIDRVFNLCTIWQT